MGIDAALGVDGPRRGWLRRPRGNRRADITGRGAIASAIWGLVPLGRHVLALLRLVAIATGIAGLLAGAVIGSVMLVAYVKASPRFAVRAIVVTPTSHVAREELLGLAGVVPGEPLLSVDPGAVAQRLATHPWLTDVRVRRRLPSTLEIDVRERSAAAVAALGSLYLVDTTGHPFKRASMADADGLPVLTGLDRQQFLDSPALVEAAFRETLDVLTDFRSNPNRPPLSEIAIDPRSGFTLFLLEGGAEIRLGRGKNSQKLAQLDRILESLGTNPESAARRLRLVDLDAAHGDRVAVQLSP